MKYDKQQTVKTTQNSHSIPHCQQWDIRLALAKFANFEQLWVKIRSDHCRLLQWYGKPCPRGAAELTEQQSAGQTSCPWTCMRGRPAPRGPACSSLSHGYPACTRSGAGCSPRYPRSSAEPSHCYAEVRHIINTLRLDSYMDKRSAMCALLENELLGTKTSAAVMIHQINISFQLSCLKLSISLSSERSCQIICLLSQSSQDPVITGNIKIKK